MGIKAGPTLARVAGIPRAEFHAAAMMAGTEHHNVALAQRDTLSALDRLDLRPGDDLARLKPLHVPMPRRINHDPTPDNALGVGGDVKLVGAAHRNRAGRKAIVKLASVSDVAQSVHVRVAVAVELHAQKIGREAELTRADIDVVRVCHIVNSRIWVVWPSYGIDGNRHRDAATVPD